MRILDGECVRLNEIRGKTIKTGIVVSKHRPSAYPINRKRDRDKLQESTAGRRGIL